MKVTVVPSQITTVEDRIAGSLGMTQLLLLAAPIFLGGSIYGLLPPIMHLAAYKLVTLVGASLTGGCLAIRWKGKIVWHWAIILWRYGRRPRRYLFNKNCALGRDISPDLPEVANQETKKIGPTENSFVEEMRLLGYGERPSRSFNLLGIRLRGGLK